MDARALPVYRVVRNIGSSLLIFTAIGIIFILSDVFSYRIYFATPLPMRFLSFIIGKMGIFLFLFFFTLLSVLRSLYSLNSLTKYQTINLGIKAFAASIYMTILFLIIGTTVSYISHGALYNISIIIVIMGLLIGVSLFVASQILILLGIMNFGKDEGNEILSKGPLFSIFSIIVQLILAISMIYLEYQLSITGDYILYDSIYEIFMAIKYFQFLYFLTIGLIGYGFIDLALHIKDVAEYIDLDELIKSISDKDERELRSFSRDEEIPYILTIALKKLSLKIMKNKSHE